MTLPIDDPYFPRTTTYWNGTKQSEETCPDCGHVARVAMAFAPDVGRNWLHCTNDECGKRWV